MKIEPKSIQRFEWTCAVQSAIPQQDGSVRVTAQCGFGGQTANTLIALALAQGRLTVGEKGASKVYSRCAR
jgi:hypothetical protein